MLLVMALVTPLQLLASQPLMHAGVPESQPVVAPADAVPHHCEQAEQAPSQGCCADGACNDQCSDCGQLVQFAPLSLAASRIVPAGSSEARVLPSPYRIDPRSLLRPPCRTLTRG